MGMEVNASYNYTQVSASTTAKTTKAEDKAAAEEAAKTTKKEDGFVKSTPDTQVTYKPDMDKVNQLKASVSRNMNAFQQMVQGMFQKQAGGNAFSLKDFFANLNVDEATRLQAQESISDDGFWGVEATANRIVDFAKAISGGDASKAEELIAAVKKGFEAAEEVWGGKLPDISGKTYDRVMELFDEWTKGGTEVPAEEASE